MNDLDAVFADLPLPHGGTPSAAAFTGIPIGNLAHHLAKNARACPVALVRAIDDPHRPPRILLENLRVDHDVRCRITQADGAIVDERFSVVECRSEDPLIHKCFLGLLQAIFSSLPTLPTAQDLSAAVDRIASLFRALERPPVRTAQGLWAELFLITHSADPTMFAEAWHNECCERYDFGAESQRIEVKSASGHTRNHHFSHAQLTPPSDIQVVIASIFVESSSSGVTLGELWDGARGAVAQSADLRTKVDEVCLNTLGSTWQEARRLSFDANLADTSLTFFDVQDIPRISELIPDGVSEIHYRSNLEFAASVLERNRPTAPLIDLLLA